MELWEIGFATGIIAVFVVFMGALALVSQEYGRSKH